MRTRIGASGARVLAVSLLAGVVASAGPAASADATRPVGAVPFAAHGILLGVATQPAGNAWAVGYTGTIFSPSMLIARWNGAGWRRVPSPVGTHGVLEGVAATSAHDAWAVGFAGAGVHHQTLILRWNGKAWR